MVGRFVCACLLTWAVLAGCSSSDDPAAAAPDASTGDQDDSSTTTDSGPGRDSATSDAPSGPMVMCAIGGAVEVEPNDTPATATPFTALTFCGVLSSGSDVDYSTFATPAGTKLGLFQGVIDGKVDFSLTLDGQTFGPADVSQFGSGTYLVKASTSAGQPASYNYRVQFDPQ
jgi:hypothetical protein